MAYSSIFNLPSLYQQATQASQNAQNAQKSTQGKVTGVLAPNNPYGIGTSAFNAVQSPLGTRTTNPVNNVKIQPNTTPTPAPVTNNPASSSTDGGTANTSTPTPKTLAPDDPSNKFNTATGQPNQNYIDPKSYQPTDPNLYGKIASNLANTSTNQNLNIGGAIGGLINNANTNYGNSGQAYQDYQKAVQDLADFKTQLAQKDQAIAAQGISLSSAQGQEANIGQAAASQLDALQQAVNEKQAALGYQIQGAQTQQSGYNSAGGLANTSQGLAQTALQQAGALAQPTGNIINVNPITGQPVAGGSLQNLANTAGTVTGIQTGAANAAAAGGNVKASNTLTAGTAGVQANQTVFNNAYSDYTNLQQSVQNVDQFGQLLTQNSGGINPFDPKFANLALSQFRNQLSSSAQGQFDSTYAALKSKISGLLSMGGNEIPSQITADANKILDGTASMGTIQAILQRISTEGNILLQNSAQKVNTAYAGLSGGNSNSGSGSGFGWNP